MKNEYLKNREGKIIGRINGEWLLGRSGQPAARYVSSVDKIKNSVFDWRCCVYSVVR
jgi:hypothetical protein